MDANAILRKLASKQPLFDSIPSISQKRICGTESEYGVDNLPNGTRIFETRHLPMPLSNGGLVYQDMEHPEYSSPEVSNPLSAVIYYEVGKIICQNANFSTNLYCNNNDWNGNTFGAHENYFTSAPRNVWCKLVPFLIARTVLSGNGWINQNGGFEISQRASFIITALSKETTFDRAVVNLRMESLANVSDFDRMHSICGDATMSQVSTFLRIGTLSLVVEMLELGTLPDVSYDLLKAGEDIQSIAKRTSGWYLRGIKKGQRGALELLSLYLERAKTLFSGRDFVTDALLVIWEDTLQKLARNPMELQERLDWVAKKFIFQTFLEKSSSHDFWHLRSLDMQYHCLNLDTSLFQGLCKGGLMEKLVSDSLIENALHEPPPDTRAYIRGKFIQYLNLRTKRNFSIVHGWDKLRVFPDNYQMVGPWDQFDFSYDILNPFESYKEHLPSVIMRFEKRFGK